MDLEASAGLPRTGIPLAYDDYFPNATIAWIIAQTLSKHGINCVPVPDTYLKPQIPATLRLMIFSGPTDDIWGRYASLLLCPSWKSAPEAANAYLRMLSDSYINSLDTSYLDVLLEDVSPVCLLAAVPSVCFSRLPEPYQC